MNAEAQKKTVLVVVAHADDMEFLAGGTIARFIDEKGYDVFEYILTDNSLGSYRLTSEELITTSAREAKEAGDVLGLKEVRLEGYRDGFLNEENPNVVRGKIAALIREVKADIVMSWDPFAPNEPHPDHRVVGMATYEAAMFADNPLFHPEHPYAPYMVTEAYWIAKSPVNAEMFVDIATTIDKKIDALLEHDCQMLLTVDGIRREAETMGVPLPGLDDLGEDGHRALIDNAIRDYCANVGKPRGMKFAEQFRYERFGMLSLLLGTDFAQSDFA